MARAQTHEQGTAGSRTKHHVLTAAHATAVLELEVHALAAAAHAAAKHGFEDVERVAVLEGSKNKRGEDVEGVSVLRGATARRGRDACELRVDTKPTHAAAALESRSWQPSTCTTMRNVTSTQATNCHHLGPPL